jgi:Fe-S-cluster containining protein
MNPADANRLCLECGLCCNGVIFADVELEAGEDGERLRSLGLRLDSAASRPGSESRAAGRGDPGSTVAPRKFSQPCAAFDGCRCRIYAERPGYCRAFECLLLRGVKAGRVAPVEARRLIRTARQRADLVKRLLLELGDDDEHVALSLRFRRVKQQVEASVPDEDAAEIFGRLTLAVHDLNVLLSDAFYR